MIPNARKRLGGKNLLDPASHGKGMKIAGQNGSGTRGFSPGGLGFRKGPPEKGQPMKKEGEQEGPGTLGIQKAFIEGEILAETEIKTGKIIQLQKSHTT